MINFYTLRDVPRKIGTYHNGIIDTNSEADYRLIESAISEAHGKELDKIYHGKMFWCEKEKGPKSTVKSSQTMADDYYTRLSEAVADFFNGDRTAAETGSTMRQLIKSYAYDTYYEGMKEGGVDNPEEEISDEEDAQVSAWITEQLGYVPDFVQAMKDANKADDRTAAQQAIFDRTELWRGSMENLGSLGKAAALKDVLCHWVVGETERHCSTCPHLATLRPHRLSWWIKNGYIPQENGSETLECHGFYCLCTLRDKDDNQVMP